jgi:hypothetical protein
VFRSDYRGHDRSEGQAGGDSEVPFSFSEGLASELKVTGQTVDFYSYLGDDHNLAHSFGVAMQCSLAWFNRCVKGS